MRTRKTKIRRPPSLLDVMPDIWNILPAIQFDAAGCPAAISRPAAEWLGIKSLPPAGHWPSGLRFYRAANRPFIQRELPWARAARSRRTVRENALGVGGLNGAQRWLGCVCRPIPGGVLAVLTDHTEKVVYERQHRAQLQYEAAIAACAGQLLCASGFCGSCRAMRQALDVPRSEMKDVHCVALYENRLEPGAGVVAHLAGPDKALRSAKTETVRWAGAFSRWEKGLKRNRMVKETVGKAPEPIASFLRAWRIHSVLLLPLRAGDAWLGFLLYGSRRDDLDWTEGDGHHLTTAARIAGSMLGRKRLQEQMLQAQKMESIGALASGMAHDFNNILSGVRATLQLLLLDRHQDGNLVEDLHAMQGEVMRAADLAGRILNLSRPSKGRADVIDVNEPLRVLTRHVRRMLPKHIAVRLKLDPHPLPVRIDAVQFEQAILNLALNARDAMPKAGAMTLSSALVRWDARHPPPLPDARLGSFVCVSVSDRGAGIPAAMLTRIFDPFFTSKEAGRGTGLGLAMVRTIVDQHQGYITVQSRPGRGSVFSLYFPLARRGREESAAEGEKPALPRGNGETVLVVDDEPVVRRSAAALLRRFGFRVLTASDGQNALSLLNRMGRDVQLALLDVAMPRLNGLECAEQMLKRYPDIRIIMMSGLGAVSPDWDRLRRRVFAMVEKPFDVSHLLRLIRQALDEAPARKPAPPMDSRIRSPA